MLVSFTLKQDLTSRLKVIPNKNLIDSFLHCSGCSHFIVLFYVN